MTDQEIVQKYKGTNPKYSKWDDVTFVSKMRSQRPDLAGSSGYPVPPFAQKISGGLQMAERTAPSAGAAIQRLVSGGGQADATAAFMKGMAGVPPRPGERTGSFIRGLGSPMNVMANEVLPGGSFLKSAFSGATQGAQSELTNEAAKGRIQPKKVMKEAGWGGASSGILHTAGSTGNAIVENAPALFKRMAKIPERMTTIFRDTPGLENAPPGGRKEIQEGIIDKTKALQGSLGDFKGKASKQYDRVINMLRATQTPKEMVKPPVHWSQIPAAVSSYPKFISTMKAAKGGKLSREDTGLLYKNLLTLRRSIGHWVNPSMRSISDGQKKGLMTYKENVQDMLSGLRHGSVLRTADQKWGAAKDIFGELEEKMKGSKPGKNVGDALKFVKDTLEGDFEDPRNVENLHRLLDLEEVTKKPVIDDLFKALTQAKFSENLAGNTISRSIAGASPFLVSALLRVVGLPFQFSLPVGAAMATSSQSPKLLGKILRTSQKFGPEMAHASDSARPMVIKALRRMRGQQD